MTDAKSGGYRPATLGVHGGHDSVSGREPGSPVVDPIVQSATFHWASPDDGELLYSRYGNNPNQLSVSRQIAAIEGTESAIVLGSGMGAMSMTLLATLEQGDHIVASSRLYGATHALLADELVRRGIDTSFVDPDDGDWAEACTDRTRVILIEIPTNPTLRVMDPRPIVDLAHAHGALVVCDATFASPANFRAASFGVDAVIQSATKYLGGHSDLIAGSVAGSHELIDSVTRVARLYGPALDPHAGWLLERGIRTLSARMARHNENGQIVAEWLRGRAEVESVSYPGLPSHPDHGVASELMSGFGGMVSFVLGGGGDAADRFVGRLRLAIAAPSLGGVETLVSQPRWTSHAALTPAQRADQGIPDGFVRLSLGIEDSEDLIADFAQALD